jgi:N-acetylglucosaminyldiphosphoundecaprenol N-acetyl-beta-D-mannosaminyltransferase
MKERGAHFTGREGEAAVRSVMSSVDLLGYRVSNAGLEADVASAIGWIDSGARGRYAACANPHSLAVASRDPAFHAALREADLLLPDGTGILLAAKLLRLPLEHRVVGYDFFVALAGAAARRPGTRFFFLGASKKVLKRITERLHREFPSINVCGWYAPPFREDFNEAENRWMVEIINDARPDVLWVGMTAPKQEKWIHRNRGDLSVPFIGAIGAAFDFYAGTIRRSPVFWRKLGLEWFHRFLQEPARLWRRNMVSTPRFLGIVVRELFRIKRRCEPNCPAGEAKLRRR